MQMSGSGLNRMKTSRNMSENGQILYLTGISQRSHSKAESILNLYKNSTKYKISKICDTALSENRQRDRERSL